MKSMMMALLLTMSLAGVCFAQTAGGNPNNDSSSTDSNQPTTTGVDMGSSTSGSSTTNSVTNTDSNSY